MRRRRHFISPTTAAPLGIPGRRGLCMWRSDQFGGRGGRAPHTPLSRSPYWISDPPETFALLLKPKYDKGIKRGLEIRLIASVGTCVARPRLWPGFSPPPSPHPQLQITQNSFQKSSYFRFKHSELKSFLLENLRTSFGKLTCAPLKYCTFII